MTSRERVRLVRDAFEADYYQFHELEGHLGRRGEWLYNFVLKIDKGIQPDPETENPYYVDLNIERFLDYLERRWNTG